MKTLYPKNSVSRDIIFADRWLKAVDEPTKGIINDYQTQLSVYRNRLAAIVNKVKHNHARYCHVEATTVFGKIRGYYSEGVSIEGVIIPDLEIHPDANDEHTAISYNKDIKNYLADFYIISNLMKNTFWKLVNHLHAIKLTNSSCIFEQDDRIIQLCEKVAAIPNRFFPDEYHTAPAQISINREKEILEIHKPAHKSFSKKFPQITNYKFKTSFSGDGVTRSWALPYFKNIK